MVELTEKMLILKTYSRTKSRINYWYKYDDILILNIIDESKNYNFKVYLDYEDFDKVKNISWYPNYDKNNIYYIRGSIKLKLHRFIMNTKQGEVVDHINRNTLDNRKCNLRNVTPQNNTKNCKIYINNNTGFKGISFENNKYGGKFIVTWNTYENTIKKDINIVFQLINMVMMRLKIWQYL